MSSQSHIPEWITPEIFEKALVASVPGYKDVHSFKVYDALGPGENYVALALKAEIKVRLTDYSLATQKFFLKVSHDNDLYNTMFYKWNVFIKEQDAYRTFIPDFEKMYRDVGLDIHFGPKHYELQVKYEYLLLEDLTMNGFRNVDRQQGLDMEHCRSVLKKLAQWHAASAVRVQRKGPYDKIYLNGGINPEGRPLVQAMTSVAIQNVISVSKEFADSHIYHEQLSKLSDKYTDFLFDHIKYNPDEFNVLCHGDFWCNNIMFQHDDKRKIKEVRLVDYQLLVCGSPAQDVVYFILTSAQYQIKIARFDELIRYYHSQLREHLQLLKYSKPVPTLGDIHKMVIDSRAYSTFAAFSIMPAALADPVKSATLDNLTSDSAESIKLKEQILKQEKISKNLELVLPWLYFKGHLEYNK